MRRSWVKLVGTIPVNSKNTLLAGSECNLKQVGTFFNHPGKGFQKEIPDEPQEHSSNAQLLETFVLRFLTLGEAGV